MNKKIKKEFNDKWSNCEFYYKGSNSEGWNDPSKVWNWIKQKLKEERIKTAKDMAEAVKIEEKTYGSIYDDDDGYDVGYNHAIDDMNFKAQQFLDSLEGENGNTDI